MVFKEYTNENFGTYHTHTVDDVYEAMYIAKYPQRIKDSTNLKEDRRALNAINKYKVDVANSSLQDALIKHKVQVVNPRNKTNFMPGFAYVKHTQKAWAPVVLPERMHGGSLPERMHGGSANKTTTKGGTLTAATSAASAASAASAESAASAKFKKLGVPARQNTQEKTGKTSMTTSSSLSNQTTTVGIQSNQSQQTGELSSTANAAANAAEALNTNTPNINTTLIKIESRKRKLKRKMEQSPEMRKAIEKINYIMKHVISKQTLQNLLYTAMNNQNFKYYTNSKELYTNVNDGFALLNAKLPAYDLIDTVRELKRVYTYNKKYVQEDPYLAGGYGYGDGEVEEVEELEEVEEEEEDGEDIVEYILTEDEATKTVYNSWLDKYIFSWFGTEDSTKRFEVDPTSENFPFEMSKFLLHEDLEESDDEGDDNFEITPEEALEYFNESLAFAAEEDKRVEEIYSKKPKSLTSKAKTKILNLTKLYRMSIIFTFIIGALFTYFIAMPGYAFAQTVMFDRTQAGKMFELPSQGDRTVVDLSKPFKNTDISLELDGFKLEWWDMAQSTKQSEDVTISVKLPSTNIELGKSFTEKLNQYLTPTPTDSSTQCMLIKNPNKALSINQQLFASKEMVLGYFIEYLNFALPNDALKSFMPEMFGEDSTLVKLFGKQKEKSVKSYVDAATNNMIEEIVNKFNEFTKTMFESDNADVRINGFFKSINEQKPSSAFRHRMDKFKQILLDHYMHHRNALQFEDHNCQISADGKTNNIKLILDHYTAGLLYDMRLNYETIAKRRVQVYVNTIPVFEKLFDIYGGYLNLEIQTSPPNLEETRVDEYNDRTKNLKENFITAVKEWREQTEDTPDLQKIGAWLTVGLGDEKTKLGQFFNEIKSISVEHKTIIERFEKRQKYRDLYNQFTTDLKKPIHLNKEVETIDKEAYETKVSALAKQTTSELFDSINSVAENANNVFGPILGRQFLGTLDMIVDSMNANIILPEDVTTINVVAANKGFMAIYKAFVTWTGSSLETAIDTELSKRVPFYETIKSIVTNAQDQQIQNYLRISKNAVRTLHTRLHNLRERTSNYDIITFSKVISNMDYGLLWDILKTSGTSLKEPHQNNLILDLFSGHTGDIINYLKNFSEPYLDMIMEIHQIETALILLHMQNNLLENTDSPKYELYEKESDIGQFLKVYYPKDNFNKYINMLTKKLFVFTGMSLTKDLLGTGIESTIIKMGGGSYDDHKHLEEELIESFIDNAEKHNKTVMSRVHSVRDINMQLKKKLLKSFIKHNPHMGEKLLRYMNQARLEM